MVDDTKLNVGIEVTADTRGAQQAQQAVQSVTTGTKQATQATAEAGARAEGAARAWEGLRMSAQGGLQSIVGLGKAASGALQAVVGAVPFAKWIMWGTALVAIVGQLTGTFREWFSSTKEGAEGAQKPLQTVKEQLEELDRATTTKLRAQLNGITTAANEAAARIDALRTVSDALNDAQEAVSLARIRANATMSPAEKLDAEQKVRETYRTARLEQAAQAIVDASANSASEQLAYAESIATAAKAAEAAKKIYDKLAADDEAARAKRIAAARQKVAEAEQAVKETGLAPGMASVENDALRAADAELAAAKKAADKEAIDAWKKEVENAKKAVDSRKTAQDEVTAKAAAAAESAKLAAIRLQAKFDALKATAEGERKVEKIDLADERYKQSQARVKAEQEQLAAEDKKRRQLLGEPDQTPYTPPKNVAPYTPASSDFAQTLITLLNQHGSAQAPTTTYAPKSTQADKAADVGRELDKFFQPLDSQSSTLDTAPIVEAVQKVTQAISDKSAADTEAITTAGAAISATAGQVPQPLDLSPVVAAQGEYHAAVSTAFAATKAEISALQSKVANQASQLRQLAARV